VSYTVSIVKLKNKSGIVCRRDTDNIQANLYVEEKQFVIVINFTNTVNGLTIVLFLSCYY